MMLLCSPFIILYLIIRKFRGKAVFGNFMQRFGYVPKNEGGHESIWIHGVSVGEVLAVQRLIISLKKDLI